MGRNNEESTRIIFPDNVEKSFIISCLKNLSSISIATTSYILSGFHYGNFDGKIEIRSLLRVCIEHKIRMYDATK